MTVDEFDESLGLLDVVRKDRFVLSGTEHVDLQSAVLRERKGGEIERADHAAELFYVEQARGIVLTVQNEGYFSLVEFAEEAQELLVEMLLVKADEIRPVNEGAVLRLGRMFTKEHCLAELLIHGLYDIETVFVIPDDGDDPLAETAGDPQGDRIQHDLSEEGNREQEGVQRDERIADVHCNAVEQIHAHKRGGGPEGIFQGDGIKAQTDRLPHRALDAYAAVAVSEEVEGDHCDIDEYKFPAFEILHILQALFPRCDQEPHGEDDQEEQHIGEAYCNYIIHNVSPFLYYISFPLSLQDFV